MRRKALAILVIGLGAASAGGRTSHRVRPSPGEQVSRGEQVSPGRQVSRGEQVSPGGQAPPGLQLAGSLEIARLLDLASGHLGIAVEYDPTQVKGVVTFRQSEALGDGALWELCNRQLAQRGYTTVIAPGARAYSVVQLSAAAGVARVEAGVRASGEWRMSSGEQRGANGESRMAIGGSPNGQTERPVSPAKVAGVREDLVPGFVTVLYRPAHRGAGDLVEPLKGLAGKTGSVGVLGDSGLLVISDLSARVEQMLGLVDVLDAARGGVVTEAYACVHLNGANLAKAAEDFVKRREGAGAAKLAGGVHVSTDVREVLIVAPEGEVAVWREVLGRLDRVEPVETRVYRPEGLGPGDLAQLIREGVGEDLRVVTDPMSGALLVTATASRHAEIEGLLARLETGPGAMHQAMRFLPIRNRPAGDVLRVLEQMAASGVLGWSSNEFEWAEGVGAGTGLMPRTGEGMGASGAAGSNAGGIGSAGLSRRPGAAFLLDEGTSTIVAVGSPRVLERVEGLVRELDVRQQQVQISVLLVSLSDSQTLDLGAELRGEIGIGGVDVKLSSLFGLAAAPGDGTPAIGASPGFSGVVLNPGEFSAVVRALETVNRGRTLSMPTVTVTNNQQASVNSVLQQPFVSVNASDTVATTSFGGTQDAGTQVSVTPQISTGDHIILEYSISLSAFVGDSPSPGLPPPRQQNTMRSVVTIPDGFTIVIGGIELQNASEGESRVPLIGQIPLLGELAKTRSKSGGRQRFYAFIRPTVLRHHGFEDLKYLSEQRLRETDLDDGWPEVRPRIMHAEPGSAPRGAGR